jgi:hypothetical protein
MTRISKLLIGAGAAAMLTVGATSVTLTPADWVTETPSLSVTVSVTT